MTFPRQAFFRRGVSSCPSVSFYLIILLLSSLVASQTCSHTSQCPFSSPCCSNYGYCGSTTQQCSNGCDPYGSFALDACAPSPICKDTVINFSDLSRVQQNWTAWDGNADQYDAIVMVGALKPSKNGTVYLPITQSGRES